MDTTISQKINLLKETNTDDTRFILNVYESYLKYQEKLISQKNNSSIILKNEFTNSFPIIVDLDKIYSKPYFYTQMRIHLNGIIEKLSNTDISAIFKNPSKFCKNISLANYSKTFEKVDDEIDIVDFIQVLRNKKTENPDYNTNIVFIAKELDEETLFKEEQIKKAIEIINIDSKEKQYEKIYDEVYSYLKKDFIANNYCDFQNNKCVTQRHFSFYPPCKKNGCCFTQIRTCKHLQKDGSCNVECMACRLYSCPYLSKRGITYMASEIVLLKAFFTKEQRHHLVFDFYKPKSDILKKLF